MTTINPQKYTTKQSQTFQMGDEAWRAGQYDEAKKFYIEAAKLYDESEDPVGEAEVLSRLAEFEISLDNTEDARKHLSAALELVKDADDAQGLYGEILIKTCKTWAAENENDKALDCLKRAQKILLANGSKNLLGDAYDQEAYLHLVIGNESKALEAYKNAANLYNQESFGLKEASALRAIARLEMKNKNYAVAHDILERCRVLYRENGDVLGEASVLSAIGSLRYIIRDIENARKALNKAVYLYGKVEHHFAEAEALLYLARVEAFDNERGDYTRAKMHYKQSIRLFDFLENDVMKRVVLEEYHNFLNRICG